MEDFWEVAKFFIATLLGAGGLKFIDMIWRNRRKDHEGSSREARDEIEYIHQRHRELIDEGQKNSQALYKKISKLEEMVDHLKNKCTDLLIENMEWKSKYPQTQNPEV